MGRWLLQNRLRVWLPHELRRPWALRKPKAPGGGLVYQETIRPTTNSSLITAWPRSPGNGINAEDYKAFEGLDRVGLRVTSRGEFYKFWLLEISGYSSVVRGKQDCNPLHAMDIYLEPWMAFGTNQSTVGCGLNRMVIGRVHVKGVYWCLFFPFS